ncbi:radical SAM protein [bacterium]|nr:radical SAM protein [bacterium]
MTAVEQSHGNVPALELDDPRAVNGVLALLDSTWLDDRIYSQPTHYDVATSVVCNIRCPLCPRQTFKSEVKSGLMKAEHFEPILPHLEVAERTGLFGLGEPFLNKEFFNFLASAKERGTYCMTSSHGMSLTPEVIEKILDSGLDELCVSMDGATARTFNFLREGADFKTVCHNVGELLRRRNDRGQSTPRVHIACALSKYNIWQACAMVRLTKKLGADRIAFSNLVIDHEEHAHVSVVGTRIFRWNLDRAQKLAERLGVDCVYFPQKALAFRKEPPPQIAPGVRYGCPSAWRALIIERDGNLKPCCYLETSYGNSKAAPLMDQVNGSIAREFRRTFTEGEYLETCKGCGQFYQITDQQTREILDEASEKIESGNFTESTRADLRSKLEHFQKLADAADSSE